MYNLCLNCVIEFKSFIPENSVFLKFQTGGRKKGIFAERAKQNLISRAWGIKVVALLLGQLVTHIVDKKGEKYGQELILVLRQKLPPRKVWPKTNSHGDEGRRQLAPQL